MPSKISTLSRALSCAGVLLCLAAGPAFGEGGWTAARMLDPDAAGHPGPESAGFELLQVADQGGLSFDLGGSEQRKLELVLSEPLLIGVAPELPWAAFGAGQDTLINGLEWSLGDQASLMASAAETRNSQPFQSLGSIHCENGVLAPDSYTASGCYFVDDLGASASSALSLGASYELSDNSRAGFSLFRQQSTAGTPMRGLSSPSTALPRFALPGTARDPLLAGMAGQPLDYLESTVTGIDLEFQLGVSTDRAGDMRLGLQLTRIMDGEIGGQLASGLGFEQWTLERPADSARVSFDWRKGAFSGGVESYYRAPVEFMNRSNLDAMTTFDVHFTWRTPWNANLSVGASNVLNAGAEETNSAETALTDPFESVYGRIPYVRYQQDL